MNNPEINTELKERIEALENTILSDGKEYSKELLKMTKYFVERKQ